MSVALVFLVAPGLTWLDAGELMAASHELGIAHPPGFPLFIMLHKFVAMVVPFGEIAFRGNLASAVLGAGGMTLLTRCAIRFGLRPSAVVCAAMMAFASPIFILHHSTIEVYSGLLLGFGLLIWLWIDWVNEKISAVP